MQVHKDVIYEYYYARIQYVGKQVVHSSHERGRCVRKPYRHYDLFVKTVPHKESNIRDIFVSNMALPVSTANINRFEVLLTFYLV